jgi:hypothetical protein
MESLLERDMIVIGDLPVSFESFFYKKVRDFGCSSVVDRRKKKEAWAEVATPPKLGGMFFFRSGTSVAESSRNI